MTFPSCNCDYDLIPPRRPKGARPPTGWVNMSSMRTKPRRAMTEGYLNQRMPGNNTVSNNQHYVQKILENPRTPEYNKEVVLAYVDSHPEKFMKRCESSDDPVANEWARKMNGPNADGGFLRRIRNTYGRRY